MLIHTPSGNHNTESVNTHINIRTVTSWWQLIQAETVDTITLIVFTKIGTTWLQPIKKTYFLLAENIDVMGKYLKITYVTIQFL